MDPVTYLPVVFGIAAAFFFASSSTFVRAGVRQASPLMALLYSLTVNVFLLWTIVLLFVDFAVDLWAWRWFVLAGVLAPVLGRFFNYTGIEKLGINRSTPITYSNPLVAVVLALVFLGQRLSPLGYVGAVCTVFGGIVLGLSESEGGKTNIDRSDFVFPVLAALFYGTSQVLRDVGIDFVSSPLVAAAVTTSASWITLMLYLGATFRGHDFTVERREVAFFAAAGVMTSIAIPTLYAALQLGTVLVVMPLQNTSPFWVLVLSFIFFRDAEPFTPRVIGGTTAVVIGVVLLSTFGTAT